MYKTLIGCLLAQATFEVLERVENFLPADSGIHHFSSEITASSQLMTFGIIPAVTQFHEARNIMSREQCIAAAKSTKAVIEILDYFDEAKSLDNEMNDFISQLNKPFWADKLNVKKSLFPAILVILAWGTPLFISKTTDVSREEIEKSLYYNAFISGTILVACTFHLLHAYRNRINLENQRSVMDFTQRAQSLMTRSGLRNPIAKLSLLLINPNANLNLVNAELTNIEGVVHRKIKVAVENIASSYQKINACLLNMQQYLMQKSKDGFDGERLKNILTTLSPKLNYFKKFENITIFTGVSDHMTYSAAAEAASGLIEGYINSVQDKDTKDALNKEVKEDLAIIKNVITDLKLLYKKLDKYQSALQSCTPLNNIDNIPANHICTLVLSGVNKSEREVLIFSSDLPERGDASTYLDDEDYDGPLLGHAK